MDAELRQAFDEVKRGQERTDAKVDALRLDFGAFQTQTVRELESTKNKSEAANRRIDAHKEEHKERRGWVATLVLGVMLSLLGSVWAWVKSISGKP